MKKKDFCVTAPCGYNYTSLMSTLERHVHGVYSSVCAKIHVTYAVFTDLVLSRNIFLWESCLVVSYEVFHLQSYKRTYDNYFWLVWAFCMSQPRLQSP